MGLEQRLASGQGGGGRGRGRSGDRLGASSMYDWRFCSLSFLLFVVNLVPVVVVDDVDVVVFVFVLPRVCSQTVPVYFKGLLDFDFL